MTTGQLQVAGDQGSARASPGLDQQFLCGEGSRHRPLSAPQPAKEIRTRPVLLHSPGHELRAPGTPAQGENDPTPPPGPAAQGVLFLEIFRQFPCGAAGWGLGIVTAAAQVASVSQISPGPGTSNILWMQPKINIYLSHHEGITHYLLFKF